VVNAMAKTFRRLVICVANSGREIQVASPGSKSEGVGLLRVMDESGIDCCYPTEFFLALTFPLPVRSARAAC
jgi:hypothetical protein